MSEEPLSDFSQVYETYHGKVLAYAAKLIGRDDADDVANEVFVKVAHSLGSLADTSRLTSWIYAITLNTVRDTARRRTSQAAHLVTSPTRTSDEELRDALSDIPDSSARTPEESAIRNEMIACYLDYVKQLPRDYYEVYVLSEFEHLSNAAIAHRLSISLSTAKIRLHRARAKVNDDLRRHCQCYYNKRGELMGEPRERSR